MRGKPQPMKGMSRDDRITPAGAGKTNHIIQTATIAADHPRRCGENAKIEAALTGAMGSPPQVRGKPSGGGADDRTVRITPAGAGKTL